MRYVLLVMMAMFACLLLPAHVASEPLSHVEPTKTLTMRVSVSVKPLATLTGLQSAVPTECVAAEVRSARGFLDSHYADDARWAFANVDFAGLAYPWHNLIVIDSDMHGTCGYAFAVAFHEWVHIRMAEYFGSMDKATMTIGCGEPMPEFAKTCRNIELIADCGGWLLSQMAGVKEHHPYMDIYGCSNENMELAQRVINED
jgi:hypothetical protein